MSDNCSNATVSAANVLAACEKAIASIDAKRESIKTDLIADARKGFLGGLATRGKTDAQVWEGLGWADRLGVDMSAMTLEGVAGGLRQLANRVLADGGTTINISANDYSRIARYWPA